MMVEASGPDTLHKPRILCLHGGGVSAKIFRLQMRSFLHNLAPYFRLVFVDGPFESEMHPDVKQVYSSMGPAYKWSSWLPHHDRPGDGNSDIVIDEIECSLKTAMKADTEGTGEWIGLLGFSQGAKLTASILLENQLRRRRGGEDVEGFAGRHWRFGIILAGRALPYALSDKTLNDRYYDSPADLPSGDAVTADFPDRLLTPTLHVHGLRDVGLEMHRQLLRDYCAVGSTVVIEWDEGHRVPIKSVDVQTVTKGILTVAKAAGVRLGDGA